MTAKVTLYTDGACRGNPGPGGWGAYFEYDNARKELYGFASETTNNRMEMMAVIEGLKALKRPCEIHLNTDSKYALHPFSNSLQYIFRIRNMYCRELLNG